MSVCRDIIGGALALLGATAPGESPTADELDLGLAALTSLISELNEAREPLVELDVGSDTVAGENQRLRVIPGATIAVTLPNSVPLAAEARAGDYGFGVGTPQSRQGSVGPADGVLTRAPRDGARVEIISATQALYFYRSDLNGWFLGSPLTLDGQSPINARLDWALSALLAERMIDTLQLSATATFARRVARANVALLFRPAIHRDSVRAAFL